jgi:small subunit ribosomal protein S14
MAKKSLVIKSQRPTKYPVQKHHRCRLCGRSRAYIRKFGICRVCFRQLALEGQLPGVRKSSW